MQQKFVFKSLYSSDDVHRLSCQLGRLPGNVLESVNTSEILDKFQVYSVHAKQESRYRYDKFIISKQVVTKEWLSNIYIIFLCTFFIF